ncbi:cell wall-binding repeat-containing protein [Frondihabitans australicus]|uniref:Putative cell wall binding repeat protein n=1 Tax=Frondihabitans australicus TaxID=386892 RepID=A0A495II31_9MICO|nr:cell wall-binding repeat-containing protein [Frondihabitans australicus]RKR75078.1 putative cell wall binding repeat protein [Frondihabitans australicus]
MNTIRRRPTRLLTAGAAALLLVAGVTALGAAPASATTVISGQASHHDLPIKPTQLAASPDGTAIYAATNSPTILVIDPVTVTVKRTIVLPAPVTNIVVTSAGDIDSIALNSDASSSPESLYDIDPQTGSWVATPLPSGFLPWAWTVTPDGTTAVLAANTVDSDGVLSGSEDVVVHPQAGTLGAVTTLPNLVRPWEVAITPDGSEYMTVTEIDATKPRGHGGIALVDAASGSVLATLDSGTASSPTGALASPDGSRFFASFGRAAGEGTDIAPVLVIDTATSSIVSTIDVPGFYLGERNLGSGQETYPPSGGVVLAGDGSTVLATTDTHTAFIDPTTLDTHLVTWGDAENAPVVVPGSDDVYIDGDEFTTNGVASSTRRAYSSGLDFGSTIALPGDHDLFSPSASLDGAPGALAHLDLAAFLSSVNVDRIEGSDRYVTTSMVADASKSTNSGVLYLTSGEEYPDSLSAGPAVTHTDARLLLTTPTSLPQVDKSYLTYRPVKKVVIVGSTASISAKVQAQVRSVTHGKIPVVRIAGADRYATSRALIRNAFGSRLSHVWIATGRDFPDALATVSAASHENEPLLLVDGSRTTLDASTAAFLKGEGVSSITVVGAESSVTAGVMNGLQALAPTTRVAGQDRYATSQAVLDSAFGTSRSRVVLTSGANWPDALGGNQFAASLGAPMALVKPTCVPDPLAEQVAASPGHDVDLLGGLPSLNAEVGNFAAC